MIMTNSLDSKGTSPDISHVSNGSNWGAIASWDFWRDGRYLTTNLAKLFANSTNWIGSAQLSAFEPVSLQIPTALTGLGAPSWVLSIDLNVLETCLCPRQMCAGRRHHWPIFLVNSDLAIEFHDFSKTFLLPLKWCLNDGNLSPPCKLRLIVTDG